MQRKNRKRIKRRKRNLRSLIDSIELIKNEFEDIIDEALMSLTDKDYEDFVEYQKDMESFSFKDVFG